MNFISVVPKEEIPILQLLMGLHFSFGDQKMATIILLPCIMSFCLLVCFPHKTVNISGQRLHLICFYISRNWNSASNRVGTQYISPEYMNG